MGIPVMSFSAGFMPSPVLRFPGIQQPSGTTVVDVKLKIEFNNGRPLRASLGGYCATVRKPLHSPATDAAVPLAFSPPQPPLASLHFSLLAPQGLAPNAVDHCLLQRAPGCSAPPAPAWSSNTGLLLY